MTPRRSLEPRPAAPRPVEPRSAAPSSAREADRPRSRFARAAILALLLVLPQAVLIGPSLVGARVLLPLDILRQRGLYLPPDATAGAPRAQDILLADLVCAIEPQRMYAVEALRSGRIPLWNPLIYCGTPFVAANGTSVFYPLRILDYLFPGTTVIAWVQLAKSVLAGLGAYWFGRRVLRVGFWAAAVGAALWPLTGFMTLWAGFTVSQVGAHLPWMLWTTDETLRAPRSRWPLALGLATAVLLVSGHAAVAAHVLLATGLFALFRAWDLHGTSGAGLPRAALRRASGGLLAVALAWFGGGLLSAPQNFTTLDYMRESLRIEGRRSGRVETPPLGAVALPAVVMPYYLGSTASHTIMAAGTNRLEGPQAAYSGLLALLVLAPLGFASRRLRRFQIFWLSLGILGLTQVLGIPLLEHVFDLPGLDTLRNNRFTLVTAWAGVAMSMAGLDALARGEARWRPWMWAPALLVLGVAAFAALGATRTPERLAPAAAFQRLGISASEATPEILTWLAASREWFTGVRAAYAALALAAFGLWLVLRTRFGGTRAFAALLGLAALAECTAQALGVNPQCERELYYPRVKVYEDLASLGRAGRVLGGYGTMPANLLQTQGFADVRGYDAADPARIIELLTLFRHERSPPPFEYAAVQYWVPDLRSPLADLVGLRYVISAGPEPPSHVLGEGGLWVHERASVLPRAFVPAHVRVVNDKAQRLALLAKSEFDPRRVAYVEATRPVGSETEAAEGTATIAVDEPEHVALDLDVRKGGVVVLTDRWAPGWKARVDGEERPIWIADHALRAVEVTAGEKRLEFRYEPASWRYGLVAAGVALLLGLAWAVIALRAPPATGGPEPIGTAEPRPRAPR